MLVAAIPTGARKVCSKRRVIDCSKDYVFLVMQVSGLLYLFSCITYAKGVIESRNYNVALRLGHGMPSVNYKAPVDTTGNFTRVSCGILCAQSSGCIAFEYLSPAGKCLLKSTIAPAKEGGAVFFQSEWEDKAYPLKWVSAGLAGLFAIQTSGTLLFLPRTFGNPQYYGGRWQAMQAQLLLENLDVGKTSVWGTNSNGDIYCRARITGDQPSGDNWFLSDGGASLATVSDVDDSVWVVNGGGDLFRRSGIDALHPCGTGWVHLGSSVKFADISASGLWLVLTSLDVAYDTGNGGSYSPQVVGQGFISIASGSGGRVCAVTAADGRLLCADSAVAASGMSWKDASPQLTGYSHVTMSSECQLIGWSAAGALLAVNRCA